MPQDLEFLMLVGRKFHRVREIKSAAIMLYLQACRVGFYLSSEDSKVYIVSDRKTELLARL